MNDNVIVDGDFTSYVDIQNARLGNSDTDIIWDGEANQNIPAGDYTFKSKIINNRNFTGSFSSQANITITQSPPPTASAVDNNTFHVLAGARIGEVINTQSEGFNLFGTASIFADFWKLDGTPNTTINYEIGGTNGSYINSSSTDNTMSLSLASDISGNFAPGDTLNFAVTSSDFYNNTGSGSFTVTVEDVTVGSPFTTQVTANHNTNLARPTNDVIRILENIEETGSYVVTVGVNDNVIVDGTFVPYINIQNARLVNSDTDIIWDAEANQNIPAGSYTLKSKIINNRNFTGSFSGQANITITQSPPRIVTGKLV